MSFLRKILVGLASLTVIVGIYVMYSRSSKTPPITIGGANLGDANMPTPDGKGGRIGSATIDDLKGTTYITRNRTTKEIDREFGFAELVRTMGDVWEVSKPWMNVYQKKFQFDIRADKGITEIETIVGRSAPKDATFQGNVTIRIHPIEGAAYKESTIYLDNLVFLAERSSFSTLGPVKLVSQDINMNGRGLEFVYNDRTQRLDYLRLTQLDTLRMKGSARNLFKKSATQLSQIGPPTADISATAPKPQPTPQTPTNGMPAKPAAPAAIDPNAAGQYQYYKCILSENVVIETPDEIIFTRSEVAINDILWSGTFLVEDANSTADANSPEVPSPQTSPQGPKPNPPTEPNLPAEDNGQIIVTCDNGILLVPVDSRKTLADFPRAQPEKNGDPAYRPPAFADPNGRSTFLAPKIDYNSATGDALAAGPVELVFHTGSVMTLEPNETSVPVTVTATQNVQFTKQSNQALFNGDCLLRMPQQGLLQSRDVTITAPQFTINLPPDTADLPRTPGDVVAAGPVELVFYIEDPNAAVTKQPPTPVSITARNQARFVPDSNQVIFDGNCLCTLPQPDLPPEKKFTLTSPRLIANLPEKTAKGAPDVPDVIALGPVELRAFVDAFDTNEPNAAPLPATVTATKHARFLPAENQVRFEGDSKAVVLREDPNFLESYILSSQKIVVDLPADSSRADAKTPMGIQHLAALGGVVTLATKKTAGEKQISGIELIARRFDYDPNQDLYTAAGPAEVWLDNSNLAEDPNDRAGGFSLKRPCWARIQNFDVLKYYKAGNLIVADAASDGPLVVRYIPIKDGKLADVRIVTANHVEANLIETAAGDTELATLIASGGITYQAEDHEFIGGRLFYDHANQLMKIVGSESFPCMVDGMLTDQIEYDLKADKIKADLVGPGGVRLK